MQQIYFTNKTYTGLSVIVGFPYHTNLFLVIISLLAALLLLLSCFDECIFVCILIVNPYSAFCLSVVCDLGISGSYSLRLAFSIKLLV